MPDPPVSLPVLAVAAVFGLILGSAVTALAYRVPRGISWAHGRSRCPACGHELGVRDLVPVLSWVSTLGRCRHCRAPIAWRYPFTELLCAAWAVLLVQRVGLQPATIPLALWGWLLIALLWIDLDFQLLPDALTFPGALIGLAAAALVPGGPRNALWGVLMGAGLLGVTRELYFRWRKIEGLGYGDVKLAAMFGVVLGWQLTLLTLFVSAALGALWGLSLILLRRGTRFTMLPFGTLLAPAAMVAFLWGAGWVNAYLRLFHR